jgi:hypothetical protein
MARTVDSQLNGFLEHCESQSALILTVPTLGTKRWIQEDALIETTISGNTFLPDLQATDELRQSIENPVDRVSVTIQNVDTDLGIELITNPEKFMFAEATIPRLYRNSRDYSDSQLKTLFRGVVTAVDADEKQVKFEFSPDYVAFGACVAADTFTGDEWKFPELPVSTPPGTGDDIIIIGDPTCFPAGTQISIPFGRQNIEDIKVNDIVRCFHDATGKITTSYVTEIFKHKAFELLKIEFADGTILNVTPEHLIYTTQGWISAGKLDLNSQVYGESWSLKTVWNIESKKEWTDVFNFEVADYHTYYAEGIAVHNRKPDPDFGGGNQL